MALSTSWKDCSLLCIVFLLSYVRTGKMTDACLKDKLCQLSQCLSFAVEVDTEFTMFSSEAQGGPCCECEGTHALTPAVLWDKIDGLVALQRGRCVCTLFLSARTMRTFSCQKVPVCLATSLEARAFVTASQHRYVVTCTRCRMKCVDNSVEECHEPPLQNKTN